MRHCRSSKGGFCLAALKNLKPGRPVVREQLAGVIIVLLFFLLLSQSDNRTALIDQRLIVR